MVPAKIRRNLAALRRRERLLTLIWGGACWLSIALILLLMGGFVDWLIDRERDTPMSVRVGIMIVQVVIASVAAVLFIFWPQVRWLPDKMLALWVEDKLPQFDHRLISAVQFNQPHPNTEGMSAELIAVVTEEAHARSERVGFAEVADHRRLKWAASVLLPCVLLFAMPLAFLRADVCFALLARQALQDVDIPHSVTLVAASPEYWPIGEEIPIQIRVTGAYSQDMLGTAYITPEGERRDTYSLEFASEDAKGALFKAKVKPSSVNVRYSARLADGRTKLPSEMNLVPRPVITENLAWIRLPAYCGLRPARPGLTIEERRYERPQGRGDVVGIPGSTVRIVVKVQKEITDAQIEILGSDPLKGDESASNVPPEKVKAKKRMTILSDRMSAEVAFELVEGLTGYRVTVKDVHGFANIPAPRRSLRLVPESPPQVTLLRDTFGPGGDFDVEGLPILMGENIRIPYRCDGDYGLGRAFILYRVLKKVESSDMEPEEEKWIRLPLTEVVPDKTAGSFNPQTGVFVNTPFFGAVPYYVAPSIDEDKLLGRTLGGGRAFLKTDGLISNGKTVKLKNNDQVEYCVEVHAMDRKPEESTPFARSETRISTVMEEREFTNWWKELNREDERLRFLKAKQENVLNPK